MSVFYSLSRDEKIRLCWAVQAALAVPFIAGIEGYVWEAIFHYIKQLPLPNPHTDKRKKLLFDAVHSGTQTGWSLKALQQFPNPGSSFELVIQRADILKKRGELGFPDLTLESPTQNLGEAILKHWNMKIESDKKKQGVNKARVAILLKSSDHLNYAFLEQDLQEFAPDALSWSWTDKTRTGLQARRNDNGHVAFRWYSNQKQLFESFALPNEHYRFKINAHPRLSPDAFLNAILCLPAIASPSQR